MDILTKISFLLKENGLKQKDLCDYLNISGNNFTDWKSGKSSSYKKYLPEIAEYLGVSVDYLIGNTDTKEKPLPEQGLSEYTKEYVRLMQNATPERQEQALQMLRLFLGENK